MFMIVNVFWWSSLRWELVRKGPCWSVSTVETACWSWALHVWTLGTSKSDWSKSQTQAGSWYSLVIWGNVKYVKYGRNSFITCLQSIDWNKYICYDFILEYVMSKGTRLWNKHKICIIDDVLLTLFSRDEKVLSEVWDNREQDVFNVRMGKANLNTSTFFCDEKVACLLINEN